MSEKDYDNWERLGIGNRIHCGICEHWQYIFTATQATGSNKDVAWGRCVNRKSRQFGKRKQEFRWCSKPKKVPPI